MPFAGYTDFADCVAHNRDKDDPDAYCGSIKHKVEDKALLNEAMALEKQVKVYQGKGFSGIHVTPKHPNAPDPSLRRRPSVISKTFWCQECGRKLPEGRHTCPKCGSEDIDIAPIKKHFTETPHQHSGGAHTSFDQPRPDEELKPPLPASKKPFARKKEVFPQLSQYKKGQSAMKESPMRKAEKQRKDAKPTTPFEEPYAQEFDVGKTLRMLQKALENQIRRQQGPMAAAPSTQQVAGELKRLEKQVRKLPGCC